MVRMRDSFWEYAKDLKNGCFLCKFCKNDFAGGISRIKSHLSRIRGCDVQIWEWRKRDSVGVVERDVGVESGIQIPLYYFLCYINHNLPCI